MLLWVVDPGTVAEARRGATRFTTGDPPVSYEGRVIWTGEGNYKARGGAYTGQAFSMGEAAVVESGQIQLVACSYPALTPDPAFYECVRAAAGRRPRGHGQEHDRVDGGLRRPLGSAACCSTAPEPAPWTSPPSRSREAAAGSGPSIRTRRIQ